MSFGFSVGDFLTVIEASRKIWKQFKTSPSYVKEARDELENISGFIQEEESRRMQHILDPVERARFQALFKKCQDLVEGSRDALNEFEDLVPVNKRPKGIRARLERFIKRLKFDEKEVTRARDRIHQALGRLIEGLQTLDSKLLQHVNVVVERTAVDVRDTKAGVERTEKGVERTEKGVERTEMIVGDTKAGVERTEKGVERTEKGIERTERSIELTKAGVDRLQKHENTKNETIEHQQIIDWICPSEVDYIDQQNTLKDRRQRGIGEWFVETQEYKDWLHRDRNTLLCSGMPGVGKTMITSFVVSNVLERYDNDDQVGVAYVYCQYARHKEQTPEYLMSSILRQLLEQHNTISDEVRALYKSSKGKHRLAPYQISDLLNVTLNLFTQTFIIIDALDELRSTDRNGFVSQVLAVQEKFNVNVYATSRYIKEIAQKASNTTQVDIRAREEDLRCSLDSILRRGSLLSERPVLLEQALAKILQLANGIFLIATLYARYLAGAQEMKQLSGILNGLKPVSDPYAKVYDSAMERLQDTPETGNTKLGLTILCWLFLAKRPLRLRELLHALAIDEDIPSFDEENVPLSSHIVNACAGLIVVDEAKNTVGLFHKTFHEYLVENQLTLFPQGNDSIGTTCVRYLSFDAFTEGPCLEVDSESLWSKVQAKDRTVLYKKRLNQFTLYEYASEHWHDHVRGGDSETADTITTFLADDNKVSASCQTMQCLVPRTTGVHVVVRHSLSNALVRHLGLCRPQLNYQDNFGRTPLSYAAEMDNLVAASCLIDAGADPNISDEKPADWGNTRWNLDAYNPLSYAAKSGHLQMTELLLEKGACINHQDCRGRDALSYAAQRGSDPVVKMLLKHGSAIDSQDSANRTALCYAAEAGSAEVVSALLEHGANVDQADNRNVTPLLLAARAGSRHTISLLVARGANVNPKCGDNDTPLSRAVEAQLVDSVRLLLRAGAEVDVNTSPRDPLSQACMTGPKEVIPLLLSAGGNVKHLNNRRVPPLAYAARNGWTDIVQLALDKGAAANYADTKSRSVLSYAVEGSSVECVELLLERGAEINRINSHLSFCEQIYYALGMKHYNEGGGDPSPADERMLNLLLSRGANPNRLVKSKRSSIVLQSPLFYAMKHLPAHGPDTKRLLELLLQHGARFDEQDGKESVLICAQQHGVEVQHLLHQYSTI